MDGQIGMGENGSVKKGQHLCRRNIDDGDSFVVSRFPKTLSTFSSSAFAGVFPLSSSSSSLPLLPSSVYSVVVASEQMISVTFSSPRDE